METIIFHAIIVVNVLLLFFSLLPKMGLLCSEYFCLFICCCVAFDDSKWTCFVISGIRCSLPDNVIRFHSERHYFCFIVFKAHFSCIFDVHLHTYGFLLLMTYKFSIPFYHCTHSLYVFTKLQLSANTSLFFTSCWPVCCS